MKRWKTAFSWLAFFSLAIRAPAGWVVEGTLTYENHFLPPRPVEKREFSFRVVSDGCRSLIRTVRVDAGNQVEAFIEPNQIRTFYRIPRVIGPAGQTNVQTAEIAHREVPRDDASNVGYLWLAYGSACYFDTRTNYRLAPLWIQDDPALEESAFTMPAEWVRIESERLPRQVLYLNDGLKRVQRGGVSVVEPWPPPYDRGFKHAVYEATEGTNLNGFFIPTPKSEPPPSRMAAGRFFQRRVTRVLSAWWITGLRHPALPCPKSGIGRPMVSGPTNQKLPGRIGIRFGCGKS